MSEEGAQVRSNEPDERIRQLEERNRKLEQELLILTQQVEWLKRQLFGRKSEKFDHPDLGLFEDEPGKGESSGSADAPEEDGEESEKDEKPKGARAIRSARIPEHLPEVKLEEIPAMVQAEPERWRRLESYEEKTVLEKEPGYYYNLRTIRYKYVPIDDPTHPPVIAPAKPTMIDGGFWGPGLIAELLCNKYLYHLPFSRQHVCQKQRYGIDLSPNTMSDVAEQIASQCTLLVSRMKELMLEGGYVRVDETFVRYLDRLSEKGSSTGYFWVYRGMNGDVIFDWQTSREHHHLADWLGPDFEGVLLGGGYKACDKYCLAQALRGKTVVRAACLAHIRRKFEAAKQESPRVVGWILRVTAALYRIEARLREFGASAEVRARVRHNQSRPLINLLGKAFRHLQTRRCILPKSSLGRALSYALRMWSAMSPFLTDGRLHIDNNDTENDIRPSAVGKKNWMFVGAPEAGDRGAVLYTLLISARNHGVDPQTYLRDVIERLPGAKPNEIDEFLPANWAAKNRDRHPAIKAPRAAA